MDIITLSRKKVERLTRRLSDDKVIGIISISSPDRQPADLTESVFDGILRLSFHDVENGDTTDVRPMNELDSLDVVNFISDLEPDLLVIHCEAGISRSCGIAAALNEVINGESPKPEWHHYNRHCYNQMMRRLRDYERNEEYFTNLFS